MRALIAAFFRFWWDFIIGDDWRIAAGIAVVLGAGAVLVGRTEASDGLVVAITAAGTVFVAVASILLSGLRMRRSRSASGR